MSKITLSTQKKSALLISGLMVLTLIFQAAANYQPAQAAAFGSTIVRLDRMTASTPTSVRVLIEPTTTNTEGRVVVQMPNFTVNASPTITTTGVSVDGATALPGTLSATGSGTTVTITGVTDLTVGTTYGFNIATGVTTPGSVGVYPVTVATQTSAQAAIDSTTVSVATISNDQIVVTASVDSTFTFALSGNNASLGQLDDGAVSSSTPINATITSNAASGWYIWARDTNNASGRGALRSNSTGATISGISAPGTASAALTAGTEGYGMGATVTHGSGTGTPTVDSAYNGTSNRVGTLDPTSFRVVTSSDGTATGAGDVTSLIFRAAISTSTPPAADYSDTVTIVAAGSF